MADHIPEKYALRPWNQQQAASWSLSEARQHTRVLMPTTHSHPWLSPLHIKISLKFVPYGFIKQYFCIGSDNSLAPTRRQAIILIIDVWFTDACMRHPASKS